VSEAEIVKSCLRVLDVGCYELVKDFTGPVVVVIVAFFSVRFAFKQIAEQHVNTLKAQIEEQKRQTRIELFKEVCGLMEQSQSIIREINTYCMRKKYSNINMKSDIDHLEYQDLMRKFSQALIAVISKVESHEIVNLMLFRVFRFSLQSIHHDLLAIQFSKDRSFVLERILQLNDDSQMYFGDFQVCLQNMAYGEVFESEVPKREPADKRYKVITNDPDNLKELHQYFWRESDWGKNCIKHEEEAKERFSS
jgi:hypothetical protein